MKRSAILNRPQHCSHYLSASTDVRIYQKPSSERKGDHEVVEGACVTIKIVLSSPLRTLPHSLRDSSLSEGAFEKFAAIVFYSHRLFLCGRFNISLRFMAHLLRKYVIAPTVRNKIKSVGAIHESPVSLFALPFGGAQTNGLHRSR